MKLDDTLTRMLEPLESRKPAFFAVSQTDWLPILYSQLKNRGANVVRLRPSQPWEPLAPLRHLCELSSTTLPNWDDDATSAATLSLGEAVVRTRYYHLVTERIQHTPLVAFLDSEDLDTPLWGDFLRFVRLHGAYLPISFVLARPAHEPTLPGLVKLSLPQPSLENADVEALSLFWEKHPKRLCSYLSQCLVFGDTYHKEAMEAVSRANHTQRVHDLVEAGFLDEDLKVVPERLRLLGPWLVPKSVKWRRKAIQFIDASRPSVRFWLRNERSPYLQATTEEKTNELRNATFQLPIARYIQHTKKPGEGVDEQQVYLGALVVACSKTGDTAPEELNDLVPPHSQMALTLIKEHSHRDNLGHLQEWLHQLVEMDAPEEAAIVATRLARWHLGSGRVQVVFGLLKIHNQVKAWALRWTIEMLYAEAYCQIGRMDLARNCIEHAVDSAPKPLSPLLVGELRLLTSRFLLEEGLVEEAQLQMSEAKQLFLQGGEGIRLGRYFLRVGELHWKAEEWEDARNVMSRALDLFRRYKDGLYIQEAQLKLGLVIRQASFNTLFSSGT